MISCEQCVTKQLGSSNNPFPLGAHKTLYLFASLNVASLESPLSLGIAQQNYYRKLRGSHIGPMIVILRKRDIN